MKRLIISLATSLILVIGLAGVSYALSPLTPDSLKGATIVDAEWVKSNMHKIKVYDVRKKAEYVEAHIPGATSAAYSEKSAKVADFDAAKDKLKLSKFPSDKNEPLIVYCNGARCWKSHKAAYTLVKAGYKKVYWFRGGFPEWKEKGYPSE